MDFAKPAEPEKKTTLFGGAVSTDGSQKFGLFGASKPANAEEKKPAGSLFGNPTTSAPGSLFG